MSGKMTNPTYASLGATAAERNANLGAFTGSDAADLVGAVVPAITDLFGTVGNPTGQQDPGPPAPAPMSPPPPPVEEGMSMPIKVGIGVLVVSIVLVVAFAAFKLTR